MKCEPINLSDKLFNFNDTRIQTKLNNKLSSIQNDDVKLGNYAV